MREKTDLKTLILAAIEGKKFMARRLDADDARQPESYFLLRPSEGWDQSAVTVDWEVEWVRDPLKWEGEVILRQYNSLSQTAWIDGFQLPSEFTGKRCKLTLVEIVEEER
jgi:hypothetical protein